MEILLETLVATDKVVPKTQRGKSRLEKIQADEVS